MPGGGHQWDACQCEAGRGVRRVGGGVLAQGGGLSYRGLKLAMRAKTQNQERRAGAGRVHGERVGG